MNYSNRYYHHAGDFSEYSVYLHRQILNALAIGAGSELLKWIFIYLGISIGIGVLLSVSGKTLRNRIAVVAGTVTSLFGLGYYLFGHLTPQVYLNGAGFSTILDFIIVAFVLFWIYLVCFLILGLEEEAVLSPLMVGVITSLVVYGFLHLDPHVFEKYQEAIPLVYGFG